jgi:hypothetical protein
VGRFAFCWALVKGAFHQAWHWSHATHAAIVLAAGAAIAFGVHLHDYRMIVALPLAVLLSAFLVGLFERAFVLYREEHERRLEAERQLAASKADPRAAALRRQLGDFLTLADRIIEWAKSGRRDLERAALTTLKTWDEETRRFVKEHYVEHFAAFLDNPRKQVVSLPLAMPTPVDDLTGYVQEQARKLRQLYERT